MSASPGTSSDYQADAADLARFGYKQELKRGLGLFSSRAVAFSYISPSTGIFTLFALGLTTLGGVFIWTWPVTAGLLDFHIDFLNKIPILWTVFVFIVVIGVIYYLVTGRRKEFAPVISPSADDPPLVSATPPTQATQPEG
jgi:hypothetical protein